MTNEIEAKEVTVAKLFSPDFIFKIPIYQRPLSWERDNFDQLFEDVHDAVISKEKQYFLGSILLQEHEHDKNRFYIVDGQQRISSLAILMAVIRDSTKNPKLKGNITSYLYQEEDEFKRIPAEMRIMPWQDLKDMFKKYIYESEGTKKFTDDFEQKLIKYNDTQDPKYHLYEAISIFSRKLEEMLSEPKLMEEFVKYLLNNVYLVYIKTNSFASAFRLFNVLNTRGLPLNTSDLLKSENIGEIKDESLRLQYANIWREIENKLGREELENIIAFIRTIKIKEKARLSIYEEYRKLIFGKNILKKGKDFIDYLKDISDIYSDKIIEAEISLDGSKNNEYKNIVTLLRRFIPFFDWIPPLIAFYQKFRLDEHLLDFVLKLEKKAILEWVAGFSPTERITSLNKIIKLIEVENDPKIIIDKLLLYKAEEISPGRSYRSIDYKNKNQIEALLRDKLDDSQFYSIYGGKLVKYILLRIDLSNWELENFPGYSGKITVEHILPQTPDKDSEWVSNFNEKERDEWTNKLGNLVLLSGIKNSRARNYNFKRKKDVYFKGKSTAFKITQNLEKIEKWTMVELNERHKDLIKAAKEIFLTY